MTRIPLWLSAVLLAALAGALSCNTVRLDEEARFPCPCIEGFVCAADGFCTAEACGDPTCADLGWVCGTIERCGEPVSCGSCEDCGFLDPGQCGGCREGAEDLPDEHFHDRNCDGIDGDRSVALFVDPLYGNDSNDGRTTATPVRTLDRVRALLTAEADLQQVLISEGSLSTSSSLVVDRDVSFHGRFSADAGWLRAPGISRPVLQGRTVAMEHLGTRPRTLSGLELRPDPLGTNGYSSIGMLVFGTLRMWDVKLVTVDGKDRAPPTTVAPGVDGQPGQDGGEITPGAGAPSQCPGASGGNGGRGEGDAAPLPGEPSAGGSAGGTLGAGACEASCDGCPGNPGADGLPGEDGIDGDGGVGPGAWRGAELHYANGGPGQPGDPGAGGGGGAGGSACPGGRGGGGGGGGAGGCGGEGGRAGLGGAHSLGVVVIGGRLEAKDLEIVLGRGGHGSGGGPGAEGGLGGRGGQGGAEFAGAVGGRGGDGGVGGHGGAGGGGAGGWAMGIWCANGGLLIDGSNIRVDGGTPGMAGVGAGPSGASGEVHAIYGCANF